MILVLLLVTLLTLSYLFVKWRYTYWKRRGVPHPDPVFLLGNIGPTLNMSSHMSFLCEQWYRWAIEIVALFRVVIELSNISRDYPNHAYSGYYKILSPCINLRDPDLIKDVLMKDHFSWHRNEQYYSKRFDPLMAHNPFVATGNDWKRGRNMLTPLTTSFKVRTLFPLLKDSCDRMAEYLKTIPASKDIESKGLSAKFSTQNVIMSSFSIDSECFTGGKSEFRELGKKIFQPTESGGLIFMLMTVCPILLDILPLP